MLKFEIKIHPIRELWRHYHIHKCVNIYITANIYQIMFVKLLKILLRVHIEFFLTFEAHSADITNCREIDSDEGRLIKTRSACQAA